MAKTLDDYKWEKRNLESQISSRRAKNDRIAGEIRRLETAYNKLGDIKRNNYNNADKVRDNTKLNKVANDVQWRGKYKDQFDNAMKDRATPSAKDFLIVSTICMTKLGEHYQANVANGIPVLLF